MTAELVSSGMQDWDVRWPLLLEMLVAFCIHGVTSLGTTYEV